MRRKGVIRLDGSEDKIKQKRKAPSKYVQPDSITEYMKERDKSLYLTDDEPTRESVRERWGWTELEMDRHLYKNGVDVERLNKKYGK